MSRTTIGAAVRRVGTAVDLLRAETGSPAVDAALRHARAAVDQLEPGPAAQALHRLLDRAVDCQRRGQSSSPELEASFRAAATVLGSDQSRPSENPMGPDNRRG